MVSLKGCFVLLAWISIGLVLVLYAAHRDNCRTIELLPHIRNKALKSYVIRTVQVPREDVCEISCYQEPNCVSYNYDQAEQSCDLNNRSQEQVSSDDLVTKYGSVHRSLLNWCHGVTCPVNVPVCQVGFTNKGYRCVCREGYVATGDHGHCEDASCSLKYIKRGCFKDVPASKTMRELLLQDRHQGKTFSGKKIDWDNWVTHLPDLVCRCARAASSKGYAFYGIQFFGECWSSADAGEHFDNYGPSYNCVNTAFKPCDDQARDETCAGTESENYVYEIVSESPAGSGVEPSIQP